MSNPDDNTHVKLIFANVSADDIILRDKLEELAKAYPSQFKLFFVLNEPPADGWSGGVGFVSEQHIRDHIGLPEEGKQVTDVPRRLHIVPSGFWEKGERWRPLP